MTNNTPQLPEEFKLFLEWKSIVVDVFAGLDGVKATVMTSPATISLGVIMDSIEGKKWDQIAGKIFGTVIDAWIVGKIGSLFKATTSTQKIRNGIAEGGTVWALGKTDYSAASYFENAFPSAKSFYTTLYNDVVNGDGTYARSVWEGIKGMADGDQFLRYYKNITFERFMSDMKDLFDPSFTVPTGVGVTFEGKKATVNAQDGSDAQSTITKDILANRQNINQVAIGTRTLDIRNLSAIELCNAVSHIDKVSFLLSNITIKAGEKLDMGSYGIYTVGGGDTLSQIAASHGMVTKDLVMLNTWLIDDGRIKFNYPTKVLIDAGTTISEVVNHTLAGSMADDVLIDHNGGNDILIGNGGADYMDGGQGYDVYYSGDKDTIKDSDGNGKVAFEGKLLRGGISKTGKCDPNGNGEYKGDGGVYHLSNGTLRFTKDSGEILTIQKFVNGDLGIHLGDEPRPEPKPTPTPNFSSPLVLDLNGDGITSTFISESNTHFDLDNNGMRERTGWVQSDDALLAFDKNQDGKINNGTELFGNNTLLKNGTKAANGFEALREYDENRDGVIDAKDNIYNALSLWQDTNSDGVSETGELHTLKELGVASINLNYSNTDNLEERNAIKQASTFTTTDGITQSINDVWFKSKIQRKAA